MQRGASLQLIVGSDLKIWVAVDSSYDCYQNTQTHFCPDSFLRTVQNSPTKKTKENGGTVLDFGNIQNKFIYIKS